MSNGDGTTTITFRGANACAHTTDTVSIGTAGFTRISPPDGSNYAGNLGPYKVAWTGASGNPGFTSIKFVPMFTTFIGVHDIFSVVVSGFDANTPIEVSGRAGNVTDTFTFALNNPACQPTPTPASSATATPSRTPTPTHVPTGTSTPTGTASETPTKTPTMIQTPTPFPTACSQTGRCFNFRFLGHVSNGDGTTTITFRGANACAHTTDTVSIGTAGFTRISPPDGSTYAGNLDSYKVVWTGTSGNPGFTSIKFVPMFINFIRVHDIFSVVVSGFDANTPIEVSGRAGNVTDTFTFALNNPACQPTPTPASSATATPSRTATPTQVPTLALAHTPTPTATATPQNSTSI